MFNPKFTQPPRFCEGCKFLTKKKGRKKFTCLKLKTQIKADLYEKGSCIFFEKINNNLK